MLGPFKKVWCFPTKRKKEGKGKSIILNSAASNLFKTSNIKPTKQKNIMTANEYKKELEGCEGRSLMDDFIEKDVQIVLKKILKMGESCRCRRNPIGIYKKKLDPEIRSCIARFFSNIAIKGTLPKIWREKKVLAILQS